VIHQSLLLYRSARYFWWAVLLSLGSVALYLTPTGLSSRSGNTWQGYVLGSLGLALILWLTALGIRKRSYRSTMGSVQGWASAHVYLGLALIVVATLHCAFQFGWNVHTLAYVLMCAVIGSGIIGLLFYMSAPGEVTENRAGGTRAELFGELFDLDARARELADGCAPSAALAVRSSIERTAIGGGALAQLTGSDRSRLLLEKGEGGSGTQLLANTDQQPVIDFISARLPRAERRSEAAVLQELVTVLCRRQMVLRRIRRDIRLYAWLKVWLYVHVPLTLALIAALLVHATVTFMYW
jgi:hypothetical protein